MWRILDPHEPLRHAVIGFADASDFPVRPGPRADPLDHIVEIMLLLAVEEAIFALGKSRAADVGMHIGIAVRDIPLDRTGLAPEKHRCGGQRVIFVALRARRKERRERAAALGPIDANADLDAVADRDLEIFLLDHRSLRRRRLALANRWHRLEPRLVEA